MKESVGDMDVLVTMAPANSITDLKASVARWERVGVSGVLHSDHLFRSAAASRLEAAVSGEPFVALSAVGALSDSLRLGTIVINTGFLHPALVLRHFAQLAALYGGERVVAGLGAGWTGAEFEALGMKMPAHRIRMERFAETVHLARQLFDYGIATSDGRHVVARDLPLSPRPSTSPRIMLGGGSEAIVDLAGHYADHLDINAPIRSRRLGPRADSRADLARRLSTTLADVEVAVERLETASVAAGRHRHAVIRSISIGVPVFCRDSEVPALEEKRCVEADMPPISLDQCPYVLMGEPARMRDLLAERRERLGLDTVILRDSPDLPRTIDEVVSRL